MDAEEQKIFEELVKPIIKWLNEEHHPHTKIIIDSSSAEIVEGIKAIYTDICGQRSATVPQAAEMSVSKVRNTVAGFCFHKRRRTK